MTELYPGTVTFLFTDVEGSTHLVKELGERYGDVLGAQQRILRAAFAEHGGREVDSQGDSHFVVFQQARDAVAAAVDAQRALSAHGWPDGVELRVRMGLHTGEPVVRDGRYLGFGVHRAARIGAVGHGGQVLLSNATRELVEDELPADLALLDLGSYELKDVYRPERLFQLTAHDLPSAFPPLNAPGVAGPSPRRRVRLVALAVVAAAVAAAAVYAFTRGDDGAPTVVPNSVVRIDPDTNRIVEVVPAGRGPVAVAQVGPVVWVANAFDDTLTRLDTGSGETRTIGGFSFPTSLAPDGARVWVGNNGEGLVTAIDGVNGSVLERVSVQGASAASSLAVGAGSLWVTDEEVAVLRLSIATPAVTKRFPEENAHQIAFGGNAAWVALSGSAELLRIDASSGSRKTTAVGSDAGGVAFGFGDAWVCGEDPDGVWRVDASTGTVEDIVHVGGRPFGIAVGAGSVWVANHEAGTVSRIDPRTNEVVATVRTGFFPLGVAVGPDGVWVTISGARDT